MERICVGFDYTEIPAGAAVAREWSFLGTDGAERLLWARYECAWDQPESGRMQVELRDTDVGLRSGVWELSLTVDSREILREKFEIPGDAEGWDPVPNVLQKCK